MNDEEIIRKAWDFNLEELGEEKMGDFTEHRIVSLARADEREKLKAFTDLAFDDGYEEGTHDELARMNAESREGLQWHYDKGVADERARIRDLVEEARSRAKLEVSEPEVMYRWNQGVDECCDYLLVALSDDHRPPTGEHGKLNKAPSHEQPCAELGSSGDTQARTRTIKHPRGRS